MLSPRLRVAGGCVLSALLGVGAGLVLLEFRDGAETTVSAAREPRPGVAARGDESAPLLSARVADILEATEALPAPTDALVAMAAADPRAAARAALGHAGYWQRRDALERVVRAWAEHDPFAALAFVQGTAELDPAARSAVRFGLLEAWAGRDPRAVLGYLVGREGRTLFVFDVDASRQLAAAVASQQPFDVLAVAEPLPKGLVRSALIEAGMARLVVTDLPAAVQRAGLAPPGPDRARWVRAIAPEFARQDPAAALEWARQFETQFPVAVMSVTTLTEELR